MCQHQAPTLHCLSQQQYLQQKLEQEVRFSGGAGAGQVQLIGLINWAVYEEAAPALRCLSVLPLRCIISGSDGVDWRLGVNQFEPTLGLNLWADSSVSVQLSESCPPSQHLLFGLSRPPRRVKLTTLSHTPGFLTVLPDGFTRAYLQRIPLPFPDSQDYLLKINICLNLSVSGCSLHVGQVNSQHYDNII
ncbi:hypothetical protein ILYODFUR_016835 [Ilyodon furcidens]|uniref:Uncharacterized protein n=1 Tax=Ilyodon furcidens TaxID=33524 RepID=A0ABV0TKE6_9TELE